MASYQFNAKTRTTRLHFRFQGKQLTKVEPVESERQAQRRVALTEETLLDLELGKLTIPSDVDPKAFILTGGKVQKRSERVAVLLQEPNQPASIGSVFDTYAETLTPGSKEINSIETEAIHGRHFRRVLGAGRLFETLSIDVLQLYVDKRVREGVVRETIKKELATLRVVWAWASKRKQVSSPLSSKIADLTLPKYREKPPFQTWDQITRKIDRDGLAAGKRAKLWESLWLDQPHTVECLTWVRENARYPFVHPMFAFAACTGARRSEIVRSERDDWDFESGLVCIRQKKADKSKSFTGRNVAIRPGLARVKTDWFAIHPGGP